MTHCVSEYDILGARAGAGGVSTGGASSGGVAGVSSGGTAPTGGVATGGVAPTGGFPTGGSTTGGVVTGGRPVGGGPPGGPPNGPPWTASNCDRALAQGFDRDPCIGEFSCEGALRDCCRWIARCSSGVLSLVNDCSACGCRDDSQCPPQAWCINSQCVPCPPPVSCRPPLFQLVRKDCPWCITTSNCHADPDCGPNGVCYAGTPCPPGCEGNPACCHGCICGAPGCGPTDGLDCSVVGCPDGYWCDMPDGPATCACVDGLWLCSPSRNVCRPF
ncbi:MAG TPA: hypothetical protein VG937_20000 [Polyangiaceae bacterium]|jgi:hypothetical protein|nr:hypothetical protein [Polyangiaceae bacterium]